MEMMPGMLLTLVVGRCLVIMEIERRKTSADAGHRRAARNPMFIPRRIANALPMLIAMLVFGGTFTVIKSSIPFFNPYSWDVAFEGPATAGWVAAPRRGRCCTRCWGKPIVTHYISIAYAVWFIVLCFTWVWRAGNHRDLAPRWMALGEAVGLRPRPRRSRPRDLIGCVVFRGARGPLSLVPCRRENAGFKASAARSAQLQAAHGHFALHATHNARKKSPIFLFRGIRSETTRT